MTNQRTGVAVNVSASDDSQSQPSKTPPHSGSITMAMSGPVHMPAETKTVQSASAAPTMTSFSMDSILSDVITEEFSSKKKGPEAEEGKEGIISKLDEMEGKEDKCSESSEHDVKIETSKTKEQNDKDTEERENPMDISLEIIRVEEPQAKTSEIKSDSVTDAQNEAPKNEALDVSIEIIDYIVGNAVEAKEKQNKETDKTKISQTSQEPEEVPRERVESDRLADALMEELRMLSGEDPPIKKEPGTITTESITPSTSVEVVPKTEIKPEGSSDVLSDEQAIGEATKSKTDKTIEVKEEEKPDDENKKAEKEDEKEDVSQDSTEAALERLNSELKFLNESFCESQTSSQNESMEWSDAVDKIDSKPNSKEGGKNDSAVKGDEIKGSGQNENMEWVDAADKLDKPAEAMKRDDLGKESVLKDYIISQVYKDKHTKEDKGSDVEKITAEEHCKLKASSSTGFIPQEKLKPSLDNISGHSSRISETMSGKDGKHDMREDGTVDKKSKDFEKFNVEKEAGKEEHESLIDAETGEILDQNKLKELEKDIAEHKSNVVTESTKSSNLTNKRENASKSSIVETDIKGPKPRLSDAQEKELLDLCHSGFSLCLKRFSQHFKSIYRLAYIHYHSTQHKVSVKPIFMEGCSVSKRLEKRKQARALEAGF